MRTTRKLVAQAMGRITDVPVGETNISAFYCLYTAAD